MTTLSGISLRSWRSLLIPGKYSQDWRQLSEAATGEFDIEVSRVSQDEVDGAIKAAVR